MIFPCEDSRLTPVEFVPKLSNVACVLQCGGIWIGGKGWGLTWKVVQCVVKPKEVVTIYGKCQIQLSSEERETIDAQQIKEDDFEDEPVLADVTASQINAPATTTTSTFVADSDNEDEPATTTAPAPTPVTKKVVKKAPEPVVETPVAVPEPAPSVEQPAPPVVEETASAPAKTVVKKVVKKVVGK